MSVIPTLTQDEIKAEALQAIDRMQFYPGCTWSFHFRVLRAPYRNQMYSPMVIWGYTALEKPHELRCFINPEYAKIGHELGVSEDASRMIQDASDGEVGADVDILKALLRICGWRPDWADDPKRGGYKSHDEREGRDGQGVGPASPTRTQTQRRG